MYCVNCGAENSEDATFCNQCGLNAKEVNNAAQGSSQDSPQGKRPVPPKHPHIKHPDPSKYPDPRDEHYPTHPHPYPPDITSANRATTNGISDERTTADPQYSTEEPTEYPTEPPSESPSPLSAPSTPGISVGGVLALTGGAIMAALIIAAITGSFSSPHTPAPAPACGAGYYSTSDGRCCPSDHPYYYNGMCSDYPEKSQTSSQGSTQRGSGQGTYYLHSTRCKAIGNNFIWPDNNVNGLTYDQCKLDYAIFSCTAYDCTHVDCNCQWDVPRDQCPYYSIQQGY